MLESLRTAHKNTYLQRSASQKQSALGIEIDESLPPLALKVLNVMRLSKKGGAIDLIQSLQANYIRNFI